MDICLDLIINGVIFTKKYSNLILSILILVFSFIKCWYSDYLLNLLFVFYIILDLILLIGYFICLIKNVRNLKQKINIINIITTIMLVIIAILVLFFPFRDAKIKYELNLYEKDRLKVVDMIKNNELKFDEIGNVTLPNKYKKVSTSGQVFIYQNSDKEQVIGFWVFRGVLSGSIEVIYSTGGVELIKSNEKGHSITKIEKIKDNWYYVETDY